MQISNTFILALSKKRQGTHPCRYFFRVFEAMPQYLAPCHRLRSLQNRACYFAKVKSKAGQALGSMSVRVSITPFLHKKSPSFEVLYTVRVFEATPQYLRTLRLVSKLPDLRVGDANPYSKRLCRLEWVGSRRVRTKKSTSFEVLFWFW